MVRLTTIKLSGFKSFADSVSIVISKPLVAVLGPNGCGKSNVIDAVRWVLGESSARQLRGESMQDVIFNGSGTRHAASRAVVELIFDNTDGALAGAWGRFAELSIKRMLTRTGESTYWINGQQVRRRDIADVFLGTGVASRGYAVIEQGMISRIIEARPEELRAHLEEAAGVSRYRVRRRETELRLRDTSEHLARLADLQTELDGQLAKLEAQAQEAQTYQALQAQLAEKQDFLALLKKQEAQQNEAKARALLADLQTKDAALAAKLSAGEQSLAAHRQQSSAQNDAMNAQQLKVTQALQAQARLQEAWRFAREQQQRFERDFLQLKSQLQQENDKKNQWLSEQDTAQETLEDARLQREELYLCSEDQSDLQDAEQAFLSAAADFENAQQAAQAAAQDLALAKQKNEQNQKLKENLTARKSRLQSELQSLASASMAEEKALLAARDAAILARDHAAAHWQAAQAAQTQAAADVDAAQAAWQNLRDQDAELRAHWQAARALLPQAAPDWTAFWASKAMPLPPELWTLLRVAPDWEAAFARLLGEEMRAFCVQDLSQVFDFEFDFENKISDLSLGAASFWQAQPTAPSAAMSGGQNANFVEYFAENMAARFPDFSPFLAATDANLAQNLAADLIARLPKLADFASISPPFADVLQARLAGVFAVPDAAILHRLAPYVPRDCCLIAPTGELAFFGGRRLAGDAASPLLWQARFEQLSADLEQLAPSLAAAAFTFEQAKNTLARRKTELQNAENVSKQSEKNAQAAELALQKMQAQHAALAAQKTRLQTELAALEQEWQSLAPSDDAHDLHAQYMILSARAAELKTQKLDAETRLKLAQQSQQAQALARQNADFACQKAQTHWQNLQHKIDDCEDRILQWQDQLAQLQIDIDTQDHADLEHNLQNAISNAQAEEAALVRLREQMQQLDAQMQSLEQEKIQLAQARDDQRQAMMDAELQAQEARLAWARFDEALREAHANEAALLARMPSHLSAQKLAQDITQIARQLQQFPAVNLAALQELTATRERQHYLQMQVSDVEQAMTLLQNAMVSMDKETRSLLQTTFNDVNAAMSRIFPQLFGGGEAALRLTEDDILTAGVQIWARPPGKKNASIHLLSGGEKALTAMSLVFALFSLKPAPFCLLDEVDAPLDDANTGRFCDLVRTMAKQTQFLYISHNRLTMEMADQLIGVTMQEKGVSRIVEVDLHTALDWHDETPH